MISSIQNYNLDTPIQTSPEAILLWAPIDVDYARIHHQKAKATASKLGYKGQRSHHKYLDIVLNEWEHKFIEATELILSGKSEIAATDLATNIPHPWIKLLPIDDAIIVINEIQAWQKENYFREAYMANEITAGIIKLYIWHDR